MKNTHKVIIVGNNQIIHYGTHSSCVLFIDNYYLPNNCKIEKLTKKEYKELNKIN